MSKYSKFMDVQHLPKKPETILPLPDGEPKEPVPIVLGGFSLIGDRGYMCWIVTLLMGDADKIWGWSLCLGDPEQKEKELHFFDTSRKDTMRKTEIPNTMIFFQAKVDPRLVMEDADKEQLEKVIAYVLPYISDEGPPPPHPDDCNKQTEN